MNSVKTLLAFAVSIIALSSCSFPHKAHVQAFKYHQNAKRKPVVAMLPVISYVSDYLPWNLSEEFTAEIQKRLINHSVVYLNNVHAPKHFYDHPSRADTVSFDSLELNDLKPNNDFVAILELIEHSEAGFNISKEETAQLGGSIERLLSMKIRVKVLDIRGDLPKVALHEIIPFDCILSQDPQNENYRKPTWGSDTYPASAYGRAHAHLERDVVQQIEKYISIVH